jgi:DNA modification methylase
MKIINGDVLVELPKIESLSKDLAFFDPPYNLGSKYTINNNGAYVYSNGSDFMNVWDSFGEKEWLHFFTEMHRIMKHGGFVCFFGFLRQIYPIMYYAQKAGFIVDYEPLAQYYISNFPKASDSSKMLSKRLGEDREVVGEKKTAGFIREKDSGLGWGEKISNKKTSSLPKYSDLTAGTSPLTRQFEGYKFGKVALKQVLEYCFIIQKPRKYGTFVDDCLAWNDGDTSISPMSFNVEGSRVKSNDVQIHKGAEHHKPKFSGETFLDKTTKNLEYWDNSQGRYPAHCFLQEQPRFNLTEPFDSLQNRFAFEYYSIDTDLYSEKGLLAIMDELNSLQSTKEILDGQSGLLKSGSLKPHHNRKSNAGEGYVKSNNGIYGTFGIVKNDIDSSIGGCSKALHNCSFSAADYDILNYFPKVSQKEREAGCGEFEKKQNIGGGGTLNKEAANKYGSIDAPQSNNHPTLKSIDLVAKLSKLFLQPYEMQVLVPFSGVCSEVLGLVKAGFNPDNITGIEISKEYVEIGLARLNYWLPKFNVQTVVKTETKEVKITKPQGTLF